MTRYTKQTVTSLVGINTELTKLQTAISDSLSRKGDSPNTMESLIDMNSNRIINLPEPVADHEPLRKGDLSVFDQYLAAYVQQAQAAADAATVALNELLASRGAKVQIVGAPSVSPEGIITISEFEYELGEHQVQVYMNGSLLILADDYEEVSPTEIRVLAPFISTDVFTLVTGATALALTGIDTASRYGVAYGRGKSDEVRTANTIAMQNAVDAENYIIILGDIETNAPLVLRNAISIQGTTAQSSGIFCYSLDQPTLKDTTPNNPEDQNNNLWNVNIQNISIVSVNDNAMEFTPYRCSFTRLGISSPNGTCFKYLGHGYSVENRFAHCYFYDFNEGVTSIDGFRTPTDQFFTDNYFYSADHSEWHLRIDNASGSVFTGNHYFGRSLQYWKRLGGFLLTLQGNYYEIGDNDKPMLQLSIGNPGSAILTGEKFWGSGSSTLGVIRVSMNKYNRSKVIIDGCLFEGGVGSNPIFTIASPTDPGSESNYVLWGNNLINGTYSKQFPVQTIGNTRRDSFVISTAEPTFFAGGAYASYVYQGTGVDPVTCTIEPDLWPFYGKEVTVTNLHPTQTIGFNLAGSSVYTIKGAPSIAPGEKATLFNYASGATREIHITKG